MAVQATFLADFTSFTAAVDRAETKLRSFESGASKVEKALMSVKGVASCKVDLEAKNAKVDVATEVKAEDLVKAIEAAGFKAEVAAVPAAEAPAKG